MKIRKKNYFYLPAIRDLKHLLLEYCNTTTGSPEEGCKVIGALQSLLKVAEMKYQCCFIANCHHSVPPSERAKQDLVNTNENSESYCCSSKNRAADEDIYSSDIDGSDKESTSSNYTTADEGYDVCESEFLLLLFPFENLFRSTKTFCRAMPKWYKKHVQNRMDR